MSANLDRLKKAVADLDLGVDIDVMERGCIDKRFAGHDPASGEEIIYDEPISENDFLVGYNNYYIGFDNVQISAMNDEQLNRALLEGLATII
ncbi:hypothetical protein [Thiomicrospira sp.]|uniref:hypothetical protein n=1 Tax=Thiomicrospira sp. TaxID=935 RepID=UPI002F939F55